MDPKSSVSQKASAQPINWTFVFFLVLTHSGALAAIWYLFEVQFDLQTLSLAAAMFVAGGLSITAGYHRLFSHHAYKSHPFVQVALLIGGATAFQDSVIKWSWDHRDHHKYTDEDKDPYCFPRGFFHAHMGWMMRKRDPSWRHEKEVADLRDNKLIAWQDRWYLPLAILVCFVIPVSIANLWDDALGGLLVAGFLRLVILYHATWSINSFAHWIGDEPFPTNISPRNSWWVALITFGEGYHANHHRFPGDARNAFRWWQFDPAKWLINTLEWLGLAWDLRRTPKKSIERAMRKSIH